METGGGGGGVSAWGTCARNDSFSTSLWWPSLQIQLSVLADRDAYPAARSMEGGCIRRLVILVVANTLSTQLIITCVPSDFARDNARKVEREQK